MLFEVDPDTEFIHERTVEMTAQWIRDHYKVPAKKGGRVKHTPLRGNAKLGTIVSFTHYINVRFDGEKHPTPCHPTWRIEYL